jgi:hypothetical protein
MTNNECLANLEKVFQIVGPKPAIDVPAFGPSCFECLPDDEEQEGEDEG